MDAFPTPNHPDADYWTIGRIVTSLLLLPFYLLVLPLYLLVVRHRHGT